jgi:hypothetical protein
MTNGIRFSPSLVIGLALAVTVWAIFYPGILSTDSLYTYDEAVTGRFTDIRLPLISLILSLFFRAGGTLGLFVLLESLLGFLGVRRLLLAITDLFFVGPRRQELVASIGILILSSPLTPMPVYFVTLWFDSWLVIFLLWTMALLLELSKTVTTEPTLRDYPKIIAILILISLVMLTRWNSLILYLPLTLTWSIILWGRFFSRRTLLALAILPLGIYLLFLIFQYNVIGVRRAHNERVTFALDLASMIIYDPSICQTLSLESCGTIQGKITSKFIVGAGAIDHTINQGLSTMEPAFVALTFSPSLTHDLWLAATHYPLTYGTVKVLNFLDYIRPRDRYYYQSFMHPNNLNLSFNPRFEPVRNKLFILLHKVYEHPILKFLSFVHLPWILVNLTGIAFCFKYKQKLEQLRILGMILFIPAAYYLSYLIALTASDFRFMYPSTLIMEVITIGLISTLQNPKNRTEP